MVNSCAMAGKIVVNQSQQGRLLEQVHLTYRKLFKYLRTVAGL